MGKSMLMFDGNNNWCPIPFFEPKIIKVEFLVKGSTFIFEDEEVYRISLQIETNHSDREMRTRSIMPFAIFILATQQLCAQSTLSVGFDNPQDSARTKVWWFHGETVGTHEGITADLEAFKQQGVGGVVYYDQVHGNGDGAFKVFSPEWWDVLYT